MRERWERYTVEVKSGGVESEGSGHENRQVEGPGGGMGYEQTSEVSENLGGRWVLSG